MARRTGTGISATLGGPGHKPRDHFPLAGADRRLTIVSRRILRSSINPCAKAASEGNEEAFVLEMQPPRRVKRFLRARPGCSSELVDYGPQNYLELHLLVDLLPGDLRKELKEHPDFTQLVEVVLDVGRLPVARFPYGDFKLSASQVTYADIDAAVGRLGEFGGDNRAGIDRCLHRISCMRNRHGRIVGLTCRAGRVVPGTAELVGDLVREGQSVLLLGCPGVGKTTALRDICRLLSEECGKRVVVVDTSNEIGGDGDIPHHAVGRARRMQVPNPDRQHAVMIEAVENHMPEVIVIDEIGTEAEALAARTIAERGVQLVATCHGNQLLNVIRNPSLNAMVGGVASVTLGDEGARLRGTQKTVLERQGPPAFSAVVEMETRNRWVVHHDTGRAVDVLLAGGHPSGEVREMQSDGVVTMAAHWEAEQDAAAACHGKVDLAPGGAAREPSTGQVLETMNAVGEADFGRQVDQDAVRLFCLGVEEDELITAADQIGMGSKVSISESLDGSDAVLTTRASVKANSWLRAASTVAGVPIFSLRSGADASLVRALRQILGIDPSPGGGMRGDQSQAPAADPALVASKRNLSVPAANPQAWPGADPSGKIKTPTAKEKMEAEDEARIAIENIVIPRKQPIELRPQAPDVLELQVAVVLEYGLKCEKAGTGADARLRILPLLLAAT